MIPQNLKRKIQVFRYKLLQFEQFMNPQFRTYIFDDLEKLASDISDCGSDRC